MLEKRVLKKSKAEHTDGTFLWSVKFFNEKTFTCWALVSFWFPRHTNTHTHTHPSTRAPSKKLIKFHVCIPEETASAGQMNNVNVSRGHPRMFWAL